MSDLISRSEEEWKTIDGYGGCYRISNYGNVKSVDRIVHGTSDYFQKGVMLKKSNNKRYDFVRLSYNGESKIHYIHELVATYFIDNPNNYPQVNHINGNKKDNRVENLEWVSASTNVKHAVSMGLFHITEDKGSWKLTEENALETLSNAILEGNSIVISPRDFGVYKSAFQKVEVE